MQYQKQSHNSQEEYFAPDDQLSKTVEYNPDDIEEGQMLSQSVQKVRPGQVLAQPDEGEIYYEPNNDSEAQNSLETSEKVSTKDSEFDPDFGTDQTNENFNLAAEEEEPFGTADQAPAEFINEEASEQEQSQKIAMSLAQANPYTFTLVGKNKMCYDNHTIHNKDYKTTFPSPQEAFDSMMVQEECKDKKYFFYVTDGDQKGRASCCADKNQSEEKAPFANGYSLYVIVPQVENCDSKIELHKPTASSVYSPPSKWGPQFAIDDDKRGATAFSSANQKRGEWWMASFKGGPTKVCSVSLINANDKTYADHLGKAKVEINGQLCGHLPAVTEPGKEYQIKCMRQMEGNKIKIISTRDKYLYFGKVQVFGQASAKKAPKDKKKDKKSQTSKIRETLHKLKDDLMQARMEKSALLNQIAIDRKKKDNLSRDLQNADSILEKTHNQFHDQYGSREKREEQLRNTKAEFIKVQKNLNEAIKKYRLLRAKIRKLKQQIADLLKKLRQADMWLGGPNSDNLFKLMHRLNQINAEIEQLRKGKNPILERIKRDQVKERELQMDLKEHQQTAINTHKQVSNDKKDTSSMEKIDADLKNIKSELHTVNEDIIEARKKLRYINLRLRKLRRERAELLKRIAALKHGLGWGAHMKHKNCRDALMHCKIQRSHMADQLTKAKKMIKKLHLALRKTSKDLGIVRDKYQRELQMHEEHKKHFKFAVKKLQHQLKKQAHLADDERERANNVAKRANEETKRAERLMKLLQKTRTSSEDSEFDTQEAKKTAEELKAQITKTREELKNVKDNLSETKKLGREAINRLKELQTKKQQISQEITNLKAKHFNEGDTVIEEQDKQEQRINQLEAQLEEIQIQIGEAKIKADQLRRQVSSDRQLKRQLRATLKKLFKDLRNARHEVVQSKFDKTNQNQQCKQEINKLKNDHRIALELARDSAEAEGRNQCLEDQVHVAPFRLKPTIYCGQFQGIQRRSDGGKYANYKGYDIAHARLAAYDIKNHKHTISAKNGCLQAKWFFMYESGGQYNAFCCKNPHWKPSAHDGFHPNARLYRIDQ